MIEHEQMTRDVTSIPSTSELVILGAPVELRDGSRVRLRQVRATDKGRLRRGFQRLSEESRYRRFLGSMPMLSEATVRYLTEVDDRDHEAIVALDDASGEGVGVVRYVRSGTPDAAEVAVTVTDAWQGRGLGTLLLDVISARAREQGIRRFTALLLATNDEMLDLLERLGPVRVIDRECGTVEVEVPIPEVGLSPGLRKLLRIAASNPTPRAPGDQRPTAG